MTISQQIFRFSVRFWTKISAETERLNDTKTETEMHTETEISAETDTETESFRSLVTLLQLHSKNVIRCQRNPNFIKQVSKQLLLSRMFFSKIK
jgi:hypothetical protein